jgi:hypothetical protein
MKTPKNAHVKIIRSSSESILCSLLKLQFKILSDLLRFECFNVNFRLLKTIYVHLLVCYLNKLQKAWCNDKG